MLHTDILSAGGRREPRDEVYCRAHVRDAGGRESRVVIVNVSPHGLMARCDAAIEVGARLTFHPPRVPPVVATVRWALGGRIGCEFNVAIAPDAYARLLAALSPQPERSSATPASRSNR